MHKVVAQKISVANKSTNGRRAHRSVVVLSKSDHRYASLGVLSFRGAFRVDPCFLRWRLLCVSTRCRPEAFRVDAAATKTVWACVASLLLSIDSASPALAEAASTSAKGTQGAVLEDLLKQQQEGKG